MFDEKKREGRRMACLTTYAPIPLTDVSLDVASSFGPNSDR